MFGAVLGNLGSHTCVVTSLDKSLKCWGRNLKYQLGTATSDYLSIGVPQNVIGLDSGVVSVALGFSHTCAIVNGGRLKCWGLNTAGQIGVSGYNNSLICGTDFCEILPADVFGLSEGVVMVALGASHSCAIVKAATGRLKCWGSARSGQIGANIGSGPLYECYDSAPSWSINYPFPCSHRPLDVQGLQSGVVSVAAGSYHTCAITFGGQLYCWGSNSAGQLGIGNQDNSNLPRLVYQSGVVQVALGWRHSCAVVSPPGRLQCWGDGSLGQIGTTRLFVESSIDYCQSEVSGGAYFFVCKQKPTGVIGLESDVIFVEAGYHHTCAIVHGGVVMCWGYNEYGQVGVHPNATDPSANITSPDGYMLKNQLRTMFAVITPKKVSSLAHNVRSLALGLLHTCVLDTEIPNGILKCWGNNEVGQLAITFSNNSCYVNGQERIFSEDTVVAKALHTCEWEPKISWFTNNLYYYGAQVSSQCGSLIGGLRISSIYRHSGQRNVPAILTFSSSNTVPAGTTITMSVPISFLAWAEFEPKSSAENGMSDVAGLNFGPVYLAAAQCCHKFRNSIVVTTTGMLTANVVHRVLIGNVTMGSSFAGFNGVLVNTPCSLTQYSSSTGYILEPSQVSLFSFLLPSSDRTARKVNVSITLVFTPSRPFPSGSDGITEDTYGTITLIYPFNFFTPGIIPSVPPDGSTLANLQCVCSAVSATSFVITTSGAMIHNSSAFIITVNGLTLGKSGINVSSGIKVKTVSDIIPSAGIFSGHMDCPAGAYWTGQPLSCELCRSGTFNAIANANNCTSCPPGKYCLEATVNPKDCESGSFSGGGADKVGCTPCPAGMHCAMYGLSAPSGSCPSGSSSPSGAYSAFCTPCGVGWFQDKTAQSFCTKCPSGSAAPSIGASACQLCDQGYISGPGSKSCQLMEHESVVLTLIGTVSEFAETSPRRSEFVQGLASLIQIPSFQIVILSVRSGSIILDVGFLRSEFSSVAPIEAVQRLKQVGVEGKLESLGVKQMAIGGVDFINVLDSKLDVALVSGLSGVFVLFSLVLGLVWRMWKRRKIVPEWQDITEVEAEDILIRQTLENDSRISETCKLSGSVDDIKTGKFKDAALGLRVFLKVQTPWSDAECTLDGIQREIDALRDCPECASVQSEVLEDIGRQNEAFQCLKLKKALERLKVLRATAPLDRHAVDIAVTDIQVLRVNVANSGGWYYGCGSSVATVKWPDDCKYMERAFGR